MNILKEILNGFLGPKVPAIMRAGYHIGERVEYRDKTYSPTHYGTVTKAWEDKVKVQFDGFELGTWLECEAIRRAGI